MEKLKGPSTDALISALIKFAFWHLFLSFLPASAFTHSPVCLFSMFPCKASSSSPSPFSDFRNSCLAERWGLLHSVERGVSCHCRNLGPSCYKPCSLGFVEILQPLERAVVITAGHASVCLHVIHLHEQLRDFLNTSADSLLDRREKTHALPY